MSKLPTVHKPGLRVWRAILLELLRRERLPAREQREASALSIAALARLTGKSDSRIRDHLESLERARFIEMDVQKGPQGADIGLTSLGRLVARLVESAEREALPD